MTHIPPYRHEVQKIVGPFVDVITANGPFDASDRFQQLLNTIQEQLESSVPAPVIFHGRHLPFEEIQSLLASDGPTTSELRQDYLHAVDACRSDSENAEIQTVANAVVAATVVTKTDILGTLYELAGRTSQLHLNQYFTPHNVAASTAKFGQQTRTLFEPAPTPENVTGQSALSVYEAPSDSDGDEPEESSEDDPTTIFDPACGSGRMLLAGARFEQKPVCLGWELDRTAARMTALSMVLTGTPGWVVWGDALTLEMKDVFRVGTHTNSTPQRFRSRQASDGVILPNSRHSDCAETLVDLYEQLRTPADSFTDCLEEIQTVLANGVDQAIGNPPFDRAQLETSTTANRPHAHLKTAHTTLGNTDSALRKSQDTNWLLIDLALAYTKPEGAVTMVVSEAILSKPSDKPERTWLLDQNYLDGVVSLPTATFGPDTHTKTSIISIKPKPADMVDVDIDHTIGMFACTSIGHDTNGCLRPKTEDGDTIDVSVTDLPAYYQVHDWLNENSITVPDDHLISHLLKHRQTRSKQYD